MYDRAPRLLRWAEGSTEERVGPGAYELPEHRPRAADGYAPFLSLASRETTFAIAPKAKEAAPGPGHYNVSEVQHNIKGGQTLQNREKRFQKFISDNPGPASYNQSSSGALNTSNRRISEAKKCLQSKISRIFAVSESVDVPSIPSCGQSHGYDINDDDSIAKRFLPDSDNTLGPAYYKPQFDFSNATLKYKGIHFGQSLGRPVFPVKSGPGPGQYDIIQKKASHYENINIKKDQQQHVCSCVPRFYEIIIFQEEKKGVPGPGKYDIKSQFQKMESKTQNVTYTPAAFLSQSQRFVPVKSIVPAPGTYDSQSALCLKKTSGSKNTPFGRSASRFTQNSREKEMPGPGSYNIVHSTLIDNFKKARLKKKKKCAFGTSAPRTSFLNQKDSTIPGPGDYQVDGVLDKRICLAYKYAACIPKTERIPKLSYMETPAPGSYDVQKSYDRCRGQSHYMPPRSYEAKMKHSSFLSTVPRCLYREDEGPGPATYSPVLWKTCSIPLLFKASRRFKEPIESTPGPATYELSTFLRHSVLKKTFNVTLTNPVLIENGKSPMTEGKIKRI
ncbi:sperm-tail PG-rich repeat-containing protein 2 [Erinaceus europaeus]|uniref:Sperm-tail PG-rich repeat-containing protein 2 n=1 Tax=Erinaceus europaeus TaxID=9365 RepID=A0ABM3X4G0_ERIEU|nr:sperm-tail PG-rich repeat-containing protein 2 [Erinaceus europaeus]